MTLRWLRDASLGATIVLAGCGNGEPPLCVPASSEACDCPTGAPGTHVCTADGLDFDACVCAPDAGIDSLAIDDGEGDDPGIEASP